MEPSKQELTLDESIKQVMQTLPPMIRNYLSQGKYTAVVKSMMGKYSLRVDQSGVLDREVMLLLMGIESPDEFIRALTEEARLDEETIAGIMQDINTQIFVPLREEERKGGAVPAQPPRPLIPPQRPAASKPSYAQVPAYAPPKQVPIQNKPVSASPAPIFEKIPTPLPASVRSPQQFQSPRPQIQNASPRPMVAAPKSAAPDRLLEDHEEPHIEFSKPTVYPRPAQAAAPVASMPARTVPPPPNLPGAIPQNPQQPQRRAGVIPPGGRPAFVMPHMPTPPARPEPAPRPTPPPPLPTQKIPVPPAPKSYGTDPYREPVDEQ